MTTSASAKPNLVTRRRALKLAGNEVVRMADVGTFAQIARGAPPQDLKATTENPASSHPR